MKEEEKIIMRYGRKGPWSVPEGYFDSVRLEVLENLPEYPAKPVAGQMTRWQRLKPYVYLAAMFAGIWCMMQMFHQMSGAGKLSLDNPPEQIAALMSEPEMTDVYMIPSTISDVELLDDISSQYSSIDDFEKDFGVEIAPEFENAVGKSDK
ncbi:MAG: hypothetical protein K2G67_06970 [Muribaculaceae bacterium]|nr:hypothetical protein [Muribaculaceae bacterium]